MKLSQRITDDQGRSVVPEASLSEKELRALFPEQAESGKVFVVAMAQDEQGKGPNSIEAPVSVFLAQFRPVEGGKNLDSDPDDFGRMDPRMAKLKGFQAYAIRHRETFPMATVKALGLEPGAYFVDADGESPDILQRDTLQHRNNLYTATNPRQSRDGFVYVNKAGKPIYRKTALRFAEPNEPLDVLFDYRQSNIPIEVHILNMEDQHEAWLAEAEARIQQAREARVAEEAQQ